jgi:hypothetical protein
LRRREREKNKCGGEEEEKEEEEEEEPPSTIFPVRHMPPMEGLPDAGNCYDCKRSGIMKKAELKEPFLVLDNTHFVYICPGLEPQKVP